MKNLVSFAALLSLTLVSGLSLAPQVNGASTVGETDHSVISKIVLESNQRRVHIPHGAGQAIAKFLNAKAEAKAKADAQAKADAEAKEARRRRPRTPRRRRLPQPQLQKIGSSITTS
ncbi:hypothetical protein B0H16DRAFT_1510039 [Mycena metata]|uniref:Uncharacterized protein n=1 Tax=Mycena metata TaxID=1033252 RepID=A0AAD7NSI9_9AGAR|nr:hypothetical protein B0H16DRAFT_1510039 [Mycena metata]